MNIIQICVIYTGNKLRKVVILLTITRLSYLVKRISLHVWKVFHAKYPLPHKHMFYFKIGKPHYIKTLYCKAVDICVAQSCIIA